MISEDSANDQVNSQREALISCIVTLSRRLTESDADRVKMLSQVLSMEKELKKLRERNRMLEGQAKLGRSLSQSKLGRFQRKIWHFRSVLAKRGNR